MKFHFMASTDEISDGYYLFESKTGGYTLPFPEDAQIDQIHYEKVKEHYEGIRIVGERDRTTGELYKAYVTYENPSISKEADIQLSLVKDAVGYEGEFEKKEHDAIIHYFAQAKYVLSDKTSSVYRFFGLIEANDSNQLIRYRYSVECADEQKGCDYDLDAIEQEVEDMMTSVEFKRE